MKLKIALCQMNVIDNKEKNITKAISMIKNAKKEGADIAILPEMFNCPYDNEKFKEYAEFVEDSYTLKSIADISKNNNIYVLAGSIPEKKIINETNEEKIYNTSFLFNDNGKILGYHRKMHLFDIDVKDKIYFKESDTLDHGDKVTVIDTESKIGKIGIGICYDIRFLELSRIMALEGAKILIYPGAFNLTTGPAHWELLFKSRALDNQVFTIGVSPCLNEFNNYHTYGHSIVCNPWGEVIKQGSYEEELLIVDIDLDEIYNTREEIPILKNRREDIYKLEKVI
ncbi:Deaminated glutathione amidase [bioreactor metagenome]|uniref:Deaminated glutathione amidase n=1 Tax=bioreactor metagenome TaxID=1076179 RepID=A0A644U8X6_9ZZZZ|nr:carbon-nitrogen hydrolase family protein [Methanobrevibacter sp.]MEA4957956.1 carbon-nitrogen hydrolase family protein [Methanobrevibacter sp.]